MQILAPLVSPYDTLFDGVVRQSD